MKLGSMTKKRKVFIEEWKSLPWKKFAKTLFHLQHRLYKASKEKDIERCKKLQSLILGSSCSRYLAVRQVTQFTLSDELKSIENWIQQPFRRVFIRDLGIRTIIDRAMECLIKYALEPYYEAKASNGSFGFRIPNQRQKNIFININQNSNGHTKMILKLDIEKWFNTIDHDKLLSVVVLPTSAKEILRSSLKAGVLGLIYPLLWKIVLNGIEDLPNELRNLGWHFKVKFKTDPFVWYPSKQNRSAVIKEIKAKIKDTRLPFKERLSKVKIISLRWKNYHKYSDLSKVNLWTISDWVYRFGKKRTSMNKDILRKEVKYTEPNYGIKSIKKQKVVSN